MRAEDQRLPKIAIVSGKSPADRSAPGSDRRRVVDSGRTAPTSRSAPTRRGRRRPARPRGSPCTQDRREVLAAQRMAHRGERLRVPRHPPTLPVPDRDRDRPQATAARREDVLGPDGALLVDDAVEQALALHGREAGGEDRVGDRDLVEELAVAGRAAQGPLEDEQGPLVAEQPEHASDGVRRPGFEPGGHGAGVDVVDHRLRDRSHPLPCPPCSTVAARHPGPRSSGCRSRSARAALSLQTGPSETRAASKTTQ